MKLVSKTPKNNFWVEDYVQEEKKFFESLGFVETITGKRTPFEKGILDFTGSGLFGSWSHEESDKIFHATFNFTNKTSLEIHYFNTNE